MIFPRQCSLSFFDAQACGAPVVFEDNIVNCQRAENNNAVLFREADGADFRRAIQACIEYSNETLEYFRRNAIYYIYKNFNNKDRADEYMQYMIKVAKTDN